MPPRLLPLQPADVLTQATGERAEQSRARPAADAPEEAPIPEPPGEPVREAIRVDAHKPGQEHDPRVRDAVGGGVQARVLDDAQGVACCRRHPSWIPRIFERTPPSRTRARAPPSAVACLIGPKLNSVTSASG